jgi:ABC-type branched-subunit amino acid transport system ATPase component
LTGDVLLDVSEVVVRFGGVCALDRCSLALSANAITGLLGPNGAGKSTLIEAVAGAVRPSAGRIRFRGEDITGRSRVAIARRGIVRSFQVARVLETLPVVENVLIGSGDQPGDTLFGALLQRRRWARRERELREKASQLLSWVGLIKHSTAPASSLSGGERRLLELARALMADPALLLLDEPTAGVYPALAEVIAERLKDLKTRGVAVLLVAHDMDFLGNVCDEVVGMAEGKVLVRGTLATVRQSDELITAYLGSSR